MTQIGLDSNILIYLAGVGRSPADQSKATRLKRLLDALADSVVLIAPVQALGETFVVLRRAGVDATEAREVVSDYFKNFDAPPSRAETALAAADLVADHKLQFWDAMIFSAAADAGCSLLLSEDMKHGFTTRGLTVVNPLIEPVHPKLAKLLGSGNSR